MNGLDRMRWLMKMPMLSWMMMLCLLKSLSVTHAEDAVASLERNVGTSDLQCRHAYLKESRRALRSAARHPSAPSSWSFVEPGRIHFEEDFKTSRYEPIFAYLKKNDFFDTEYEIIPATRERPGIVYENLKTSTIRYLVLCYGIPLKISEDPTLEERGAESVRIELRKNRAAVDHELAWMGRDPKRVLLSGPFENPLYHATRSMDIKPENGVMMVARLDGPSPEIAMRLVDQAMEAEREVFGAGLLR